MKHKQFDIIMILLSIALVVGVKCHGQDSVFVGNGIRLLSPFPYPIPDTITFKIKYKNHNWVAYNVVYDEGKKVATITLFKPLRTGWYSYKKLIRRGFECKPFRGSIFINYKRYLELVNNKTISK